MLQRQLAVIEEKLPSKCVDSVHKTTAALKLMVQRLVLWTFYIIKDNKKASLQFLP